MDNEKEDIKDVQKRFKKVAPIAFIGLIVSVLLIISLPPIKRITPELSEWPVWWFWPAVVIFVATFVSTVAAILDACSIYIEWKNRRKNTHSL